MSDLSKNVLCGRAALPNVTTSPEQRDFLYSELLPGMKEAGLIDEESYAGFVRWAFREASDKVGLNPVVMVKRSGGRKPGKKKE